MTYKAVLSVEKNQGSLSELFVCIYLLFLEKHWITLKILAERLSITDSIEEQTNKCTKKLVITAEINWFWQQTST